MTYRKKAARAARPANARLPLIVEAAPVNLGELMVVGVVVFFGEIGLPVPVPARTGAWLERVVGQALIVMVTTDGTTGAEEMTAAALEAASLETAAAVLFA
jgi:hypothetical protein